MFLIKPNLSIIGHESPYVNKAFGPEKHGRKERYLSKQKYLRQNFLTRAALFFEAAFPIEEKISDFFFF